MNEIDIFRLNIERFRHLLETESDGIARQIIENLLHEFENKLAASARVGRQASRGVEDNPYVSPETFAAN